MSDLAATANLAITGAEAKIAEGAVKIAVDLAPPVIEKVRMWWAGKTLMLLGPPRAGKTSFLDYLEYGILRTEQRTDRTVDIDRRQSFIVKLGRDGSLLLRVRRPVDCPGDVGAFQHVRYIERYKPSGIVIVLDATSPLNGPFPVSSVAWFEEFCRHFDSLLRRSRSTSKAVAVMVIAMNKWDKLVEDNDGARKGREFEGAVRTIVEQDLKSFRYAQGERSIPILRCALVKGSLGTTLIDDLISALALALVR